jgi:hypothetical protein
VRDGTRARRHPADEPATLQTIEHPGHRAGGATHAAGQLAGGGRSLPVQEVQALQVGQADAECLRERLVQSPGDGEPVGERVEQEFVDDGAVGAHRAHHAGYISSMQ